jgi:hypothetical protein
MRQEISLTAIQSMHCNVNCVTTVINFLSGEALVIHSTESLKVSLLKQFRNFVCLNRSVTNAFKHFVISVLLCNNFYNNNNYIYIYI